MPSQPSIIIARRNLSVLGGELYRRRVAASLTDLERSFFELIATRRPHVIIVDLSDGGAGGLETIKKIRRRTRIPIVLVHCAADPEAKFFRRAGASGCIIAPVEMAELNDTLHEVLKQAGVADPADCCSRTRYRFGQVIFEPDRNRLSNPSGASVKLTTLENDALFLLVTNARRVCTRVQMADLLYGKDQPASERAIDLVINRLRKKLAVISGRECESFVKTEFRRGYAFASDVVDLDSDVAA